MKHFTLITNVHKDVDHKLTNELKAYIEAQSGHCVLLQTQTGRGGAYDFGIADIPKETECIIALGGDGTLIRVATKVQELGIPLIGINLGNLGYLCELEQGTAKKAIDHLMADEYIVEERMMLAAEGRTVLNDIVLHRVGDLSVIHLLVYVNGEFLGSYDADGMILATPTGSTGYSMSAGGPIMDPKARMMLLTPINAHNLNARSIVLSADDTVEVEVGSRHPEKDEQVMVSFDGDTAVTLGVGDKIRIFRAENVTRICKLNKESFLDIMRRKMANYH